MQNAYSGAIIARPTDCDAADVNSAVSNARVTFDSGVWADRPAMDRRKILDRWALAVAAERLLAHGSTSRPDEPFKMLSFGIQGGALGIAQYARVQAVIVNLA